MSGILTELVNLIGFKVDEGALNRAMQRMSSFQQSLQSSWMEIAGSAIWAMPALALDKAIVNAAASAEDLHMKFEVLLGDADAANKMTEDVKKLADASPYSTKGLTQAASTLLGYNETVKNILPDLNMLGDVAMGNEERFQRLAYALAKSTANSKLQGEELGQFTDAGFNPLSALSGGDKEKFKQLRKDMEAGKFSIEMVQEAFKIATSKGGQFFEGSKKGALTFNGMWSTMKDSVGRLLEKIGTPLLEPLKNLVDNITDVATSISERLNPATSRALFIMMNIVAVLPMIAVAFGIVQKAALAAGVTVRAFAVSSLAALLPWIAGLAVAFLLLEDFIAWQSGGESLMGKMFGDPENLKKTIKDIVAFLQPVIATAETIKDAFLDIVSGIVTFVAGVFSNNSVRATAGMQRFLDGIITFVTNAIFLLAQLLENVAPVVMDKLMGIIMTALGALFNTIWMGVSGFLISMLQGVIDTILFWVNKLPNFTPGKSGMVAGLQGLSDYNNPQKTLNAIYPSEGKTSTINVDAKIQVAVPEGTSDQQKKAVSDQATEAARKVFNAELTKLYASGGYKKWYKK